MWIVLEDGIFGEWLGQVRVEPLWMELLPLQKRLQRLSAKELMLLNCGAGEDSWESLGLQGDQTSQ